ncbi:hypothetical protein D3C72_2388690 [compost metagenome]
MQQLHAREARGIAGQLQIHHRILGLLGLQQGLHLIGAAGVQHAVAAALKRAAQGAGKSRIVFNQQ